MYCHLVFCFWLAIPLDRRFSSCFGRPHRQPNAQLVACSEWRRHPPTFQVDRSSIERATECCSACSCVECVHRSIIFFKPHKQFFTLSLLVLRNRLLVYVEGTPTTNEWPMRFVELVMPLFFFFIPNSGSCKVCVVLYKKKIFIKNSCLIPQK